MRNIDAQIMFYLSKHGWYLGDSKINLVNDRLPSLGIDPKCVNFTNSGDLAWARGSSINLNQCLGWVASLPQLDFLVLHEYFHIKLGHCFQTKNMSRNLCHGREYDCDRLALKYLIDSGKRSPKELYDAIQIFEDVICEEESETHPSSKSRYKRLLSYLKREGVPYHR